MESHLSIHWSNVTFTVFPTLGHSARVFRESGTCVHEEGDGPGPGPGPGPGFGLGFGAGADVYHDVEC